MKNKTINWLVGVLVGATLPLRAGPRTSASYSIPTDTTDLGGTKTASAAYSIDASIGGATGIATAGPPATPTHTAKTGYIAQLYEVTGLALNAAPLTINEGGTRQLSAWQTLDDTTFLAVPATSVTWSVIDGPLTSISAGGLTTAGIVYQAEPASAQGSYAGNTSPPLSLMVLNANMDDYREYAGDQMDDDWQVLYFGPPPNPIAGPNADPDGDGQDNYFEFTAGFVPLDRASHFTLTIAPVPGEPMEKNLLFGPLVNGRTYKVKFQTDLNAGTWTQLPGADFGATEEDDGDQRTVTDTSATEPTKFYRVEITNP